MKQLIIIGARGFGRAVCEYIWENPEYNNKYTIKGFLDENINALDKFDGYPSIISSVENYEIEKDDLFICGLGDLPYRHKYIDIILNKGGVFMTFVHHTARVCTNVKIGEGSLIAPFVSIGSGAILGKYTLIQEYALIPHDGEIGDWSRVDAHVVITGGAKIGNNVTVHTGAIINQNVIVGDNSKIGAGSFVARNVKENVLMFGNPAKEYDVL